MHDLRKVSIVTLLLQRFKLIIITIMPTITLIVIILVIVVIFVIISIIIIIIIIIKELNCNQKVKLHKF